MIISRPKIELVGQVITSTNYATDRLFNFNSEHIKAAAQHFAASGVTKIEVPEGVLDPDNKFNNEEIDREAIKRTVNELSEGITVIASYFGSTTLGKDNLKYLKEKKIKIDRLLDFFPDLQYIMLHPPAPQSVSNNTGINDCVKTWNKLAEYARRKKRDFRLCLHNHYDTSCETSTQVRKYLKAIKSIDNPALRWGPDTGHCHGMGIEYLDIFKEYVNLIGNYFHIKARIPAFDKLHGGDKYKPERDIWGNKAEIGTGLYGGFVNAADPEIQTPFKEIFAIIKGKKEFENETIYGSMEIDVPRQHPLLEIMCAVMYFKYVHGISPTTNYSYEKIVENVFRETSRNIGEKI